MVPAVLAGWRWHRQDLGVVLYSRDGSNSTIRIRSRQAPLIPPPSVISTLVDELQIADSKLSPYEGFVTVEGEFGTLVGVSGVANGLHVELCVAILFGDDWYTTIEGVASPPQITSVRATVHELAQMYSLGLGAIRRRRYRYMPPAGWVCRTRGLIDEWHLPGSSASISVFPSRPLVETAAGAVDRALHELVLGDFVATSDREAPLETAQFETGLARFVVGQSAGKPVHHDVAVLQDDRYYYVSRLQTPAETLSATRAIFSALVETIEPLPRPQPAVAAVDPALSAVWAD